MAEVVWAISPQFGRGGTRAPNTETHTVVINGSNAYHPIKCESRPMKKKKNDWSADR